MNVRSVSIPYLLLLALQSASHAHARTVEMSPNALGMVETVAAAMLGHVEFFYERDEVATPFRRGLRSLTAACVPPGTTDPAEEARIAREAHERQALGEQLASIADLDASGFVSDEESVEFRMAIETVLMARALSEEWQRPVTLSQLAVATGSSELTVEHRVVLYRDVQPQLAELSPGSPMGLVLEPIPEATLEAR